MRLREYARSEKENKFIYRSYTAGIPAFLLEEEWQNLITKMLSEELGELYLLPILSRTNDYIPEWCNTVYRQYSYRYTTLYNTLSLKYNPLENYNMTEHEETENDGSDVTTSKFANRKNTNTFGEKTITHDNGQRVDNENLGAINVTNNIGKRNTVNTGQVAPFETQVYNNKDKDTTSTDATTDTSMTAGVQNSYTSGAHTDTDSHSSYTDSAEIGGHEDVETLQHGHDITRDLTRSGNVGVTTSQQMIQSERDLANFNLARIICMDLRSALCILYDSVLD